MNIVIIGYGRMGKEIESVARERGHNIILTIDKDEEEKFNSNKFKEADVAIEFTLPGSAVSNYKKCFENNVPVVSGTTGWLEHHDNIISQCRENNAAFFYASNFSLGVNVFFEINKKLANLINSHISYDVSLEEIHHVKKLDAPSGTAISLANDIIENIDRKESWTQNENASNKEIQIDAKRVGQVNGEHTIIYNSPVDSIEIKHSAKSRKGFAMGAILAAEFIKDKKGVFSMNDLLNIDK